MLLQTPFDQLDGLFEMRGLTRQQLHVHAPMRWGHTFKTDIEMYASELPTQPPFLHYGVTARIGGTIPDQRHCDVVE